MLADALSIVGVPANRKREKGRVEPGDLISRGFPPSALNRVKSKLGLSDSELASVLGVSAKTVSRMRGRKGARLGLVASDRLFRLARVFALASRVLQSEQAARNWMRTPQIGLGNRVPLDLLRTEPGAREVEQLLGRMECGVLW